MTHLPGLQYYVLRELHLVVGAGPEGCGARSGTTDGYENYDETKLTSP